MEGAVDDSLSTPLFTAEELRALALSSRRRSVSPHKRSSSLGCVPIAKAKSHSPAPSDESGSVEKEEGELSGSDDEPVSEQYPTLIRTSESFWSQASSPFPPPRRRPTSNSIFQPFYFS
jgi:hypothetical protein